MGVVINGVGNIVVMVKFFKGDFLFVVVFDFVEGYYWE